MVGYEGEKLVFAAVVALIRVYGENCIQCLDGMLTKTSSSGL